ncbi:MAG: L,D-transpeptidase [Proteobacteria bacterium]|nr:L,D-transpeptidase [Verrucomicrobiota bacterium]NBU08818.1 L,D-transpeptidase [Pseudomonadota bacterium]
MTAPRIPTNFRRACTRLGVMPTRHVFTVRIATQRAALFEGSSIAGGADRRYRLVREFVCSTSKFGIGQIAGSNCTPLGLHRIAEKHGAGAEPGTVFKARKPIGNLRDGLPLASITTRILWLDGLDPGFNRGGDVDTFQRYIYIHGFGDQASLGRPASHGCIHLADADLVPLFDLLPVETLVWIAEK